MKTASPLSVGKTCTGKEYAMQDLAISSMSVTPRLGRDNFDKYPDNVTAKSCIAYSFPVQVFPTLSGEAVFIVSLISCF